MPRILKIGIEGGDVKKLQRWLNDHNFDSGSVDGIFGKKTSAAVKQFQGSADIVVDGMVGFQTRDTIDAIDKREKEGS